MDNDSDIWVLPRASVMINQINHKLNRSTNNYVQTLPHLKPDTVVNWDIDLPSPTQHLALVKDDKTEYFSYHWVRRSLTLKMLLLLQYLA